MYNNPEYPYFVKSLRNSPSSIERKGKFKSQLIVSACSILIYLFILDFIFVKVPTLRLPIAGSYSQKVQQVIQVKLLVLYLLFHCLRNTLWIFCASISILGSPIGGSGVHIRLIQPNQLHRHSVYSS